MKPDTPPAHTMPDRHDPHNANEIASNKPQAHEANATAGRGNDITSKRTNITCPRNIVRVRPRSATAIPE